MNSGRSAGRQVTSISFSTWLTMPPPSFTAAASLGVDEVQRHLHVDLLVGEHALEVDVLHLLAPRMHVARAQQHLLLGAVDLQRQDRGECIDSLRSLSSSSLWSSSIGQRLVLAAVDDARDLAVPAQAAARTRSLQFARSAR